nr:EOG090X05Q1 [Ceriodaphnia reticulata]
MYFYFQNLFWIETNKVGTGILLGLRTFLSDAYKCDAEWKARLNNPLLEKLKNENFYGEILTKFQNEGKASPIDVDLFSNLVLSELHLEDLEVITNKFRRCPNTVHALPSTGHTVIRTYLEFKNTETMMRLLDDRLNYGLFLDYYLSNLLMDSFLKEENYRDSAKIAIQLMLQEEFDHPITSHLALYSCYGYLNKPQPEPWDPQPKPKPAEPVEQVKVRVDYIREPYFDDHFDLTKPQHLIGKTLVGFGKHFARKSTDSIAHTSILVGWALFEKHDKVIQSLDTILKSNSKPLVFREGLELCKKLMQESTPPDGFLDEFNNRISQLEIGNFIVEGNLLDELKQRIKDTVNKHENADIQRQKEVYKLWEQQREEEIKKQTQAIERRQRLAVLEAKKKELEEKEERLNFFDNLDEWELRYEEKMLQKEIIAKQLESHGRKVSAKMQRQAEEDAYYPPEITANRKQ